jgi:hypothetical protein
MDYCGLDCRGYTVTLFRTSTIREQRSIWKEEVWSSQLLSRYSCGETEYNHSIQISASREKEVAPQKVKQTGRQLRTDRLGKCDSFTVGQENFLFVTFSWLVLMPTQSLFSGYLGLFTWELIGRGVKLITYLYLLPTRIMNGAIPLLPHTPYDVYKGNSVCARMSSCHTAMTQLRACHYCTQAPSLFIWLDTLIV